MNEKLVINFEVEKDGKKFSFSMPYGSSYGAAYDAAHDFMTKILEMSKNATEKAKRVEAEKTEEEAVK